MLSRRNFDSKCLLSAIMSLCLLAPSLAVTSDCFHVEGLEVEHLSLLSPHTGPGWTPPVVEADPNGLLIGWRVAAACGGRNVSLGDARLTLTAVDHPEVAPAVCTGRGGRTLCGGGGPPGALIAVDLEVTVRAGSGGPVALAARGWFVRGLDQWGGARWIGLPGANDTAVQFRGTADLRAFGFRGEREVVRAMLFVAGLGGHRAAINGRALDPTSVRASVTEWHNRTMYFADDVTADVAAAAGGGGKVVVALEVFKHWYALSNNFYPKPYGARALKAVLLVQHANGSTFTLVPTIPGPRSSWRHGSGALVFDDLHAGQTTDGRRATPAWESAAYRAEAPAWAAPVQVAAPTSRLLPYPMARSRVLERVRPTSVAAVPSAAAGATYRFTLPYEVAGFCTVVLPAGCPAGASVVLRHGECVDPRTNLLCPVEAPGIRNSSTDRYTCRGSADGTGAHDTAWRRLALGNNASDAAHDDPRREAFTPAFKFSAFKFFEVSYSGFPADAAAPDAGSVSCSRIGAGFDWIGDVAVAAPPPIPLPRASVPTRCGRVPEHQTLSVGCAPGHGLIDAVVFASFGTTAGNCTAGFHDGIWSDTGRIGSANRSVPVVEAACLGRRQCTVLAEAETFAKGAPDKGQPCPHVPKSLAVEVHCAHDPPGAACSKSCSDGPKPQPPPAPPAPSTTGAHRLNAVVAAARSTSIANYVMDVPT